MLNILRTNPHNKSFAKVNAHFLEGVHILNALRTNPHNKPFAKVITHLFARVKEKTC